MDLYSELVDFTKDHSATLVAVSKTKPNEAILALYGKGQRIFGENRVPELCEKQLTLPTDIQWHMIGHLQTNKVKPIVSFISMIHSVDRTSLLKEINKEATKANRKIDVLLQIKVAQEETKHGWDIDQLFAELKNGLIAKYPACNIRGVMGMATFTSNEDQVKGEFKTIKKCFDQIQTQYFPEKADFDTISMGMSGDYKLAIEEGSTMVRIGSLLFGKR